MEICDAVRCDQPGCGVVELNSDLAVVLEALRCEAYAEDDRRKYARCAYVRPAVVELTDPIGHVHRRPVHSRDANQWGVGVISQAVLPVGVTATVQIVGGDGVDVRARGCIIRCREVLPGWYEGAMLFEQEHVTLSSDMLERMA